MMLEYYDRNSVMMMKIIRGKMKLNYCLFSPPIDKISCVMINTV